MRQIFEELEKGSSRSLVGEALVGKTYLLKQICQQGKQRLDDQYSYKVELMRRWVATQKF